MVFEYTSVYTLSNLVIQLSEVTSYKLYGTFNMACVLSTFN